MLRKQLIIYPEHGISTKTSSDLPQINMLLTTEILRLAAEELCTCREYHILRIQVIFYLFTSSKHTSSHMKQWATGLTDNMEDDIL